MGDSFFCCGKKFFGMCRLLDLSRQILISELVYVCGKTPEEITAWIDELIDVPPLEGD